MHLARANTVVADLRACHEWIDHVVRAVLRYHERRGNHLAAAITFFSILNAVPLLMIAFAATGYLLAFSPALLAALETRAADAVPPELSDTVEPFIETVVEQRNAVAGAGLVAALWAGTWWMTNLREAISSQWEIPPRNPASPRRLLSDLLALAGLWVALIVSLAVTAIGTGVAETLLGLGGWHYSGGNQLARTVVALILGLAADWLICYWLITQLPRVREQVRGGARAALIGAVGFELLRHGLTVYLAWISATPGGAIFGSLLGLLVFAYLVSRFVLLVAAWAATDSAGPESWAESDHAAATRRGTTSNPVELRRNSATADPSE